MCVRLVHVTRHSWFRTSGLSERFSISLFGVLPMVPLVILPMVPLVSQWYHCNGTIGKPMVPWYHWLTNGTIGRANGIIGITIGTNGTIGRTLYDIGIALVPLVEPCDHSLLTVDFNKLVSVLLRRNFGR